MNRSVFSIFRISILILLGLIVGGYSLFQAHKLISGPVITIFSPENGSLYNSPLIEITGKAKNVAYLNLNDKKIFTDENGNFKEKLLLSPGYNILKLDAKDKFGTYTEKRIELILKEY